MKKNVMPEELKVNGGNLTENDKEEIKSLLKVKKKLKEKEPEERLKKAIEYIENLEEENKRLRKTNEKTIKIKVFYDDSSYEVDTQIEKKFIEGKDYYIADSYKEPTKIKFMEYEVSMSIDNHYIILAKVYDYFTAEIKTISFKRMCLTKHQASEQFLFKKWSK